jgi:hypothetical protein
MKNKIEVEAECCYIGEVETFSSGFTKRTICLKEQKQDSKYPTYLAFTLKKDNTGLVNETYKGRILKVTGFVESRDWQDPQTGKVKFFTDVVAVKVALADASADVPPPAEPPEDLDDMPF